MFVYVRAHLTTSTAQELKIEAMPTFTFFLNGEMQPDLQCQGADEAKLKANIAKLAARGAK
jgi:hypothetical protein